MCNFLESSSQPFGFLVMLSTGYELYMKLKKDDNPSPKKLHRSFTINDTNNDVQLNGVKSISNGDLDLNDKVPRKISETTDQKMNSSTVILVQQSNTDLSGKKVNQGMVHFTSTLARSPFRYYTLARS